MRWLAVFLFLFTAAPGGAHAQAPEAPAVSAEQQALAYRFVTIGGSVDVFIEAGIAGFEAAALSHGVAFTSSQRERLRPLLTEVLTAPARIFVDELANHFAATASPEDMHAALAYYESEPGRRYAAAGLEFTMALSLFAASGGRTELPNVLGEDELDEAQRRMTERLATAFAPRLGPLDREELIAANIDPEVFIRMMARFFVSRLSIDDLEAAAAWAESAPSLRLEGASAERRAAEDLATLRALRALDAAQALDAIRRVVQENPT